MSTNEDVLIKQKLQRISRRLDQLIFKEMHENMGFSIQIFPLDKEGKIQYASNCSRTDMRRALRSVLDEWDAEANRASMVRNKIIQQASEEVVRKIADEGKVVETGWLTFKSAIKIEDANEAQKSDMRKSFFAGCAFLLDAMTTMTEPGEDATNNDMRRMANIHTELQAFDMELRAEIAGMHNRSTPNTKQ